MRFLKPSVAALALPTAARRALFVAAACAIAALPALEAARIAAAGTLGASADPALLSRVLALDPANPAIEHRLGLALFYAAAAPDRKAGLAHLRRATEIDPREALYWSDLAPACEAERDTSCGDESVTRALDASPMTPRLYWAAGNYELRAGLQTDGLAAFRRLLALDPSYAGEVFQVCSAMLGSPELVQSELLAGNRNQHVAVAFVKAVSGLGAADTAFEEWQTLVRERGPAIAAAGGGPEPLSLAEVEPYLDRLIALGRQQEGVAVWRDFARLGVIGASTDQESASGLVFNGGFESAPLNAGFDWRFNDEPFAASFRTDDAHSGLHALRVEFTGDRNGEYEPVDQVVPVVPGHSYTLSAFVRSQAIASDTGPRLRLRDLACAACLDVASADVQSTTPWHQITVAFTVGPETRFVRLSVWRPRSRGYPAGISGELWLDDVSITEQPVINALSRSALLPKQF